MRTGRRNTALNHFQASSLAQKARSVQQKPPSPPQQNFFRRWALKRSLGWAIVALLIATGSIVGSGWLAVQLIVNPQKVSWINQVLPGWIPSSAIGSQPLQTLQDIQAKIRQSGKIPGEPLFLGKNKNFSDGQSPASDWLIPLLISPGSSEETAKIVELRLYQSVPDQQQDDKPVPRFQLIKQLAIAGPEESFVIAPLITAQSTSQGTTRSLPLTSLKRFEDKVPSQGIWLNLSGVWTRRNETVAYGQIIHYNPSRFFLSPMLEWSSTTGQTPTWQNSGKGSPKLTIDQTVGMEPQFKVYQVEPRNFLPDPIQLVPVSLTDPALPSPTYSQALLLARSGLWSTSWKWLQSYKQQSVAKGEVWSDAAQSQMELVHLHAQATQTQAEQSWASPNQQVLANLIDGRWLRALQVFQISPENSWETASLLRADSGQLQNRVETALSLNPSQLEVKTWGALLIAAQQNRLAAIAWLKKQPKTTSTEIRQIDQVLKCLEPTRDQ